MEDSFRVRVDRAFGSLEASSSSSTKSTPSSLGSLWCLTDEEIQRNEWIREKVAPHKHKDEDDLRLNNPEPFSSFLDNLLDKFQPSTSHQVLESDIQDLDDEDEDENQQPRLCKPDNGNNEEWDIQSSVGMDWTLDHEEEEDGYDKVAVGSEEPAERFYMRDVNDYEVEIDSNNELPNSFTDVMRDPRANHMAAKLRLKEDDESSQVVPDYVRNPSKYIHYTFDSLGDVDEESNRKAYMDLFNSFKGSNGMAMEEEEDPPRSIIFTPKKKSSGGLVKKSKVDAKKVSITAEEVCVMDGDEPEITTTNKSSSLQKGIRRYRTKANVDEEELR